MKWTQSQFDKELERMIVGAKKRGESSVVIVSKELHDRVVRSYVAGHRMPTACNAMWKLWEKQGSIKANVLKTTSSGKSTTIRIRYNCEIMNT